MAQVFDFQGVIALIGERYSQKTVGCWRIRGSFTVAEPREQSERQLEMEEEGDCGGRPTSACVSLGNGTAVCGLGLRIPG